MDSTNKMNIGTEKGRLEIPLKKIRFLSFWFAPTLLLGAFLLASLAVLWLIRTNTFATKLDQLADNTELAAKNIRSRLQGNQDYLLMLAKSRADGILDAQSFQERASQYVADHPELINITWVNTDFVIHDVSPFNKNKQIIGLKLELPEPKRASHLAKEQRKAIYTLPFEAIQGKPSFEIWIPVFKGNEFIGLFAGVYSCEKVIRELVPAYMFEHSQVSLVDNSGNMYWVTPAAGSLDVELTHRVPLASPEDGPILQFKAYGQGALERSLSLLELLCLALAFSMVYAMWRLKREIDASRRAEEELKQSEERLNEAQRIARIGNWELDIVKNVLTWSKEIYRLFEINPEEFKASYEAFLEAIHPDDRDAVNTAYTNSLKTRTPYTIDHRLRFSDGRIKYVHEECMTFYDSGGKPLRSVGTVQDITEHRQAEEALKISEQKFRSLFEESLDCLFVISPDGKILDMNKKGISLFGYDTKEEIMSLDQASEFLVNPQDRERILALVSAQGNASYEIEIKKKNGEIFTAHCLLYSSRDDSGAVTSFRGSLRDISDTKRYEENLKKAKENWERTFDAVADMVFVQDTEGRILQANKALCDRLGKTAEEIKGVTCYTLMHANFGPPINCPRNLMISDGFAHTCEINESRLGGFFCFNISPLYDPDGKLAGSVHVARDITETKRLQELESRTQRLETAGKIAGQVAHDFNNLLGPMIAYPEFLKDALADDISSMQMLSDIEKAANAMADINQQLLTLSRRGHVEQKALNINELITDSLSQLNSLPETIQIDTELDRDLMNIKGAPAQIVRVILNLVTNAIDAMQNCGVLTIKTENFYVDDIAGNYDRIPKGEYVKITISDTGCGIPDEILPKIFDAFFTTKSADKKRGTGLGLSVVAAVMADHNGHIDLKSKVGMGTSCYLYFPITRAEIDKPESEQITGGSERVLVVDDDSLQRGLTLTILSKLGYQATAAESGEKAISLLLKNPQDIIVLDMIMPPGIDGAETYRKMLEVNPNQKAIIISGFSETSRVIEAQRLGAGAYVRKPVNMKTLAAALRAELDKKTSVLTT